MTTDRCTDGSADFLSLVRSVDDPVHEEPRTSQHEAAIEDLVTLPEWLDNVADVLEDGIRAQFADSNRSAARPNAFVPPPGVEVTGVPTIEDSPLRLSIAMYISFRQTEPKALTGYNMMRQVFLRRPGPRREDDIERFLTCEEVEPEFLRVSRRLTRAWLAEYVAYKAAAQA